MPRPVYPYYCCIPWLCIVVGGGGDDAGVAVDDDVVDVFVVNDNNVDNAMFDVFCSMYFFSFSGEILCSKDVL